ncbi:MAG: YggS family pyridoxal phosphate-dependent enzyme, partial [Desulfovibrionales bacterium]
MTILERYQAVIERIEQAAKKAGRDPAEVTLIAVSKRHPASAVAALAAAGHKDFGENYIQEALAKKEGLDSSIRWHFIGHLQTNKARFVPGNIHLLHALDSERLARALHSKLRTLKTKLPVLIQVNLARETQKSGVYEENLPELAEQIISLAGLDLTGLMVMPPFSDKGE